VVRRKAVVYVRQSTPGQVQQHLESQHIQVRDLQDSDFGERFRELDVFGSGDLPQMIGRGEIS
jgi:DNA invertase Pin-like site-specific DNA recombinase